jgi:hypothetical protein
LGPAEERAGDRDDEEGRDSDDVSLPESELSAVVVAELPPAGPPRPDTRWWWPTS